MRIIRKKQIADRLRSYKLYINNDFVGNVEPEKSLEIIVQKGDKVTAKIDWCSSNTFVVEDKDKDIIVGTKISDKVVVLFFLIIIVTFGLMMFFKNNYFYFLVFVPLSYILFFVTFGRNRYLKIYS